MKTDVHKPYQKWLTRITTQKRKDKKRRRKILMIIKGKLKKTSKTKCKFHGEELLGPQTSLRNTPCLPAPNHTRGEVIRRPSQIKNNSYSVIRTSMTSLALVARPRLPVDHLETTYIACKNCRCREFLNTGLGGGEGEEVFLTESAIEHKGN